ncbi:MULTISPECIES: sensor histidine kinase [Flavobacteriaceae]|uniref:sensor histidine kinase n=1 Tax=Flavobacteriaceae TaxID=49546 RepID=UPI0014912726|nr:MULTISPECIES: sensor histidine kinase [Allomuricauda]MDC6366978.1 sensor histidine kinase [Muricauda sp. AC10]
MNFRSNKHLSLFEPIVHLCLWAVLLYITYSNFGVKVRIVKSADGAIEQSVESNTVFLIAIFIDLFLKSIMFYGNAFMLLPKFFRSPIKSPSIVKMFFLFALTLGLSLLINFYILNNGLPYGLRKGEALIGYTALIHLLFLLLSIGYRLAKDWYRNEKLKRRITQEKLKTELDFLKAQINPHFLFNTLNNLYGEARKIEDKTVASGIAKLAHMMRYMIYDSNVERVTLDKEIQYLESFIQLQKLRLSENDPLDLQFDWKNADLNIKVAPILFIPFIENAFKHGLDINQQSFIHIALETSENQLFFEVENSKFDVQTIHEHSGVGLINVKRRLALLYPEKHTLKISDQGDIYRIRLELIVI